MNGDTLVILNAIGFCIHIRNARFCTCKILVVDIRLCYYYYIGLFLGKSCLPRPGSLIRTIYDSFEGGIFSFYWELISGGGIGFGCGALRPFAHGKTLYFNGCGHREARTVEMDLRNAK